MVWDEALGRVYPEGADISYFYSSKYIIPLKLFSKGRILTHSLSLGVFIVLVSACSASRQVAKESAIGVLYYQNYDLKISRAGAMDTAYYIITNAKDFEDVFMKVREVDAKAPNFAGQTLVVISAPAATRLRVIRAAIASSDMNVYAGTCDVNEAGCPENGLAVSTVPKSLSVKRVKFYVNGSLVKQMPVSY